MPSRTSLATGNRPSRSDLPWQDEWHDTWHARVSEGKSLSTPGSVRPKKRGQVDDLAPLSEHCGCRLLAGHGHIDQLVARAKSRKRRGDEYGAIGKYLRWEPCRASGVQRLESGGVLVFVA